MKNAFSRTHRYKRDYSSYWSYINIKNNSELMKKYSPLHDIDMVRHTLIDILVKLRDAFYEPDID